MSTSIPIEVVVADHELEQATEKSTERLAKHRWEQTLDPAGPQHSLRSYAKAVGRNYNTVATYANGYNDWVIGASDHSLADCIQLANISTEKRVVAEVIAEAEGVSIRSVTDRRGGDSLANVVEQARERAERTGVSIEDAAKDIGETRKKSKTTEKNERTRKKAEHTLRYISIEGKLAGAKRKLSDALIEAHDVGFSDDEMELLRSTIDTIRAVLTLIDLRFAGTPDVDWDMELANLGGSK